MNETVNQEKMENEAPTGKTFTQAEIDEIISDRLRRERLKYANYDELKEKAAKFDAAEEANKTELQKATEKAADLQAKLDAFTKADTVRQIREKVSAETGVPLNLLTGDDEETCRKQAKDMLAWKQPQSYPHVKDAGEVGKISGRSTRDEFAAWFAAAENN